MNINNPTTFSLPDLTLSTSNSSGSAGALRADDTILVYDTTLPDAITYGQSGATGSASTASRRDHDHAMAASDATSAATQAEMEAASSTTVYVSPGRTRYHPGVAKSWIQLDQTGTQSITGSYNVASIADRAVGTTTVTLTDDFSNDDFSYVVFSNTSIRINNSYVPSSSTYSMTCGITSNFTGGVSNVDASRTYVVAFGDQ